MNGSTRRQPGERRLSSGRSQLTMSGIKFVRRIARPRTGSGSISSFGLKKSSAPLKRSRHTKGLLNTGSTLLIMLKRFGARGRVDDAVPGVHRDREHRSLLPLEHVPLRVALEPDLGRAASLDHEENLLVHVLLGVQRSCRRHLDHVAAPLGLRAMELDKVPASAGTLPRRERKILHLSYTDPSEDGNALGLHEGVVGCRLLLELAVAGLAGAGRLVPVGLVLFMRHGNSSGSFLCVP